MPVHVAFVNENTLGHASYLLPLARGFEERPELGVIPHLVNAVSPGVPGRWWGDFSVRGLRRFGLDFHCTRWRLAVSRHVREEIERLRTKTKLDAIVVNTQSVGLCLDDFAEQIPIYVALDATFAQLSRSPWFAPNRLSRWMLPMTVSYLRSLERRLFQRAAGMLPWSSLAAQSLVDEYGIGRERIHQLPPSVAPQPDRAQWPSNATPRIFFLGGDFKRKGGPALMESYRRFLADRFELHVMTQSELAPQAGVVVHRGIAAHSPEWRRCWEQADVFVFPSALETFGIVLLEALSFQVPVVSSGAGAAREILDDGRAGVLLDEVTPEAIAASVRQVIDDAPSTRARVEQGRRQVAEHYALPRNLERLAELLTGAS
jgi:glycosyltransferase involved in cell wall biosynthesis